MNVEVGNIVEMKKTHPCGTNRWEVLRTGIDYRLRCTGCGHQITLQRSAANKSIKKICE